MKQSSSLPASVGCVMQLRTWVAAIEQVYDELTDLIWQREQVRMIGKMIDANPRLLKNDKPFLWDVRRWYMIFAVMAVRRQTDRRRNVISLANLISDIRAHPECITRDLLVHRFRDHYPQADSFFEQGIVDGEWDKWKDSTGKLNVQRLTTDLSNLAASSKALVILASTTIAHTSKRGANKATNLTFQDLDDVIDRLERLTIDYYGVLTGRSPSTLLPTPQFDWHEQFSFAWRPRHGA